MIKETIQIENLKCGGCANTIKTKIEKLESVSEVSVDIDNSKVTVDHIGKVERSFLVETLGKLGYPEIGNGSVGQKVKSYISCTVGKLNS